MRLLAGSGGSPVVVEVSATNHVVEHRLGVAEGHATQAMSQLRAAIAGIGVEGVPPTNEPIRFDQVVELRLSTRRRPLRTDVAADTMRSLLSALAQARRDEQVLLQWIMSRPSSPRAVPNKIELLPESWWRAALSAPFKAPEPADAETRAALRDKHAEPGWRVLGRIAVASSSTARSRQLVRGVLGALRSAEAPGVRLQARSVCPGTLTTTAGKPRISLNASELSVVCGWPIGPTAELPVVRLGSRRLPVPEGVAFKGRIIGESTWPGKARALALTPSDSLRHLHVIGPTGAGKSTLLLNLIEQDMKAARSVVVIEPKGDLIRDVLARVPDERVGDVVLLDPTDPEAVVGLNPLAGPAVARELAAEQLLATFHGLYAQHWGPRTSDILHASLLTLARTPGMSLVALPMLLSNQSFRRKLVGGLNDPIGLGSFWAQYEAWSDAERSTATAPVLNKLRPFLMRPSLRRVIGQSAPKFDLRSVFLGRKILLVNVAKGQLGAEAAQLLGALVLSSLWQTVQERSRIAPERRHPVMVFIDEFQDYLHLPTDLAEALTQARGLGVGFTLAHQHLGQLQPSIRSAVLANARSRICFQLGSDDAKTIAGMSTLLGIEDFASLDAFQFYAQLVAGGATTPWCSGRSMTPSKPNGIRSIEDVVRRSRTSYARPVGEIDREIEEMVSTSGSRRTATADDLAPRRRARGQS
jgi:hypothetical protein